MAPVARELAKRSGEFSYAEIPEEVLGHAKLHLLDALGVALAASGEERSRFTAAVRRLGAGDECTAIGLAERLPAPSAALINGTLIHTLEYDDTHTDSIIHGSSVVVPAALAAAEKVSASGRKLVTALVLGWEVIVRLGLAAPGAFQARGFHTTGVCGSFAAAAVAGKIEGLSETELTSALGIAGSQASGLFEYVVDGASVKRSHPGWASHNGLIATRLAQAGLRGPQTVFEGRFGFYSAYADRNPDAQVPLLLSEDIGKTWHTPEMSYKPYPCCHFNHAFLDCAARLASNGAVPEAIEQVVCHVPPEIVPVVCEPSASKAHPKSGYEARFSLPYSVSAMLCDGEVNLDTYSDERLGDERRLSLARRVRYELDPYTRYPRSFPGRLEIETTDGRTLTEQLVFNRGGPQNPLSEAEIVRKFRENASRVLDAGAVDLLVETVQTLDEVDDLRALCEPLQLASRISGSVLGAGQERPGSRGGSS